MNYLLIPSQRNPARAEMERFLTQEKLVFANGDKEGQIMVELTAANVPRLYAKGIEYGYHVYNLA